MERPKINYHISSIIWLSLEKYYNRGLTSQKAKEIIESLPDLGSNILNLSCREQGINNNWNVMTSSTNEEVIDKIVSMIEKSIEMFLIKNDIE